MIVFVVINHEVVTGCPKGAELALLSGYQDLAPELYKPGPGVIKLFGCVIYSPLR